jgi:hypothetical protein
VFRSAWRHTGRTRLRDIILFLKGETSFAFTKSKQHYVIVALTVGPVASYVSITSHASHNAIRNIYSSLFNVSGCVKRELFESTLLNSAFSKPLQFCFMRMYNSMMSCLLRTGASLSAEYVGKMRKIECLCSQQYRKARVRSR